MTDRGIETANLARRNDIIVPKDGSSSRDSLCADDHHSRDNVADKLSSVRPTSTRTAGVNAEWSDCTSLAMRRQEPRATTSARSMALSKRESASSGANKVHASAR